MLRRRGVLLLVVLGLLATFGLIGITFVILTGHERRGAEAQRRVDQYADPADDLLNQALLELLRGSKKLSNPIATHSIGEDIYGSSVTLYAKTEYDNGTGTMVPFARAAGNQLLQMQLTSDQAGTTVVRPTDYVGCVVTMLEGPAAGRSTRIVGVSPLNPTVVQMLPFADGLYPDSTNKLIVNFPAFSGTGVGFNTNADPTNITPVALPTPPYPAGSQTFAQEPLLTAADATHHWLMALTPNTVGFGAMYVPPAITGYTDPVGPGGANEPYDAPDFQTMFLAWQLPIDSGSTPAGTTPIPSFHRPSLVNYWVHQNATVLGLPSGSAAVTEWQSAVMAGTWPTFFQNTTNIVDPFLRQTTTDLKRRILLRPLPEDHFVDGSGPMPGFYDAGESCFTGSNLLFNATWDGITPPLPGLVGSNWDVDCDGDGINDAIWIDLGMPVRSTSDGRLFKPLFAFLVVDMDGRLNVNAQGCLAQTRGDYYGNVRIDSSNTVARFGTSVGTHLATVARGQGFGPAEINLLPVLGNMGDYEKLLTGATTSGKNVDGRYGERDRFANPALAALSMIGRSDYSDPLCSNALSCYPIDYTTDAVQANWTPAEMRDRLSGFGSPPDLKGSTAIALDPLGQPVYVGLGDRPTTGEVIGSRAQMREALRYAQYDQPYELDLSCEGSSALTSPSPAETDNPFTPAELERLLRPFDVDAPMLPDRLINLVPSLVDHRHELTTLSQDVPTGPGVSPRWLLEGITDAGQQNHLKALPLRSTPQILRALLIRQLFLEGKTVAQVSAMNTAGTLDGYLRHLCPPELMANLRMDLNRPFGDGKDDNNNDEVDEPGEADVKGTPEDQVVLQLPSGGTVSVKMHLARGADVNNDNKSDIYDDLLARQLYARQLFILAMLLRDPNYVEPSIVEGDLSRDQLEDLTVRRLAQWAVNVVDFRDPDAIMTPFEFDYEPFTDANGDGNPWDVDGYVGRKPGGMASPDNGLPYRGLVWGCEQPELLITETFADHDFRVANTDRGTKKLGPGANDDETADQIRIPEGSAFIELLCVRNANHNNGVAPGSLYTYNPTTTKWHLDLARSSPAATNGQQYPVWRLAITESHLQAPSNDVRARREARPDSFAIEPEQSDDEPGPKALQRSTLLRPPPAGTLPADTAAIQIERLVWFTDTPPIPTLDDHNKVFYRRRGSALLEPGQYAVVGPRITTQFGAKIPDTPPGPKKGEGSPHQVTLAALGVETHDPLGNSLTLTPGQDIRAAITMTVAADPPNTTWNGIRPDGIGLNISEPLPQSGNYYPKPTANSGRGDLADAYTDLDKGTFPEPLVLPTGETENGPFDLDTNRPLGADGLWYEKTALNYKTVLLQRLANPLLPYDREANPYITVDWMPIDLNLFNGEDGVKYLHRDHKPPKNEEPANFRSRERGFRGTIWNADIDLDHGDPPSATTPTAKTYQTRTLRHTLGYLNTWFFDEDKRDDLRNCYHLPGIDGKAIDPADPNTWRWLLKTTAIATPDAYIGAPKSVKTFPWLTWNNRPFANHLELTLVPSGSPARLLSEYGHQTNNDPYAAEVATTPDQRRLSSTQYGGLFNFFSASNQPSGTAGAYADNYSPQLYRLLDFVCVPSRFAGTKLQGDPQNFEATAFDSSTTPPKRLHDFAPPFHWIPDYREPGLVNLNTIASPAVWQGLTNYFPDMDWSKMPASSWRWDEFVTSRQGYNAAGATSYQREFGLDMTTNLPTRFAQPFRPASSAGMVPLPQLMKVVDNDFNPANDIDATDVDSTLLRRVHQVGVTPDVPLFALQPAESTNKPDANPFYYFQGMDRLGNMVTTRSNVFAVWITVGYFEVHPRPTRRHADGSFWTDPEYAAVYPDGYALGQELGSDTGETKRHRAFYIIDRSIPVGFQRGEDLNVENTVILRRFVE